MKLEDLLTHRIFVKLEQTKTRWELTHTVLDGSALAVMCDKDFDRLIESFSKLVEMADHEHFFVRSWQDGTLVCECGAWK